MSLAFVHTFVHSMTAQWLQELDYSMEKMLGVKRVGVDKEEYKESIQGSEK